MLELASSADVPGARASDVLAFLLTPTDAAYRAWWPGVHARFHVVAPGSRADHVGDRVLMDERVGRRRLRFAAEVVEVVPDRRVEWRLRWLVRLPAWLSLDLEDVPGAGGAPTSVRVRHVLRAGWTGPGRAVDPLLRLYLSPRFAADLEDHARTEFDRLGAVLAGRPPG